MFFDDGSMFDSESDSISLSAKFEFSVPGVFAIYCQVTDCMFFGEAENLYEEVKSFYYSLRLRTCENKRLLEDYKEYGSDRFTFFFLEKNIKDSVLRKQKVEKYKADWLAQERDLY